MLLVRRGEGLPGAGEAFSGAGDGLPGAMAGAPSVVTALTRDAILRLRRVLGISAHLSGCGAASSKGAVISKQQRLAETGTGSLRDERKDATGFANQERASGKILAISKRLILPVRTLYQGHG